MAFSIPAVEFGLSIWLLVGWHTTAALISTVCLLLVFTLGLIYIVKFRSEVGGCGCFGTLVPQEWSTGGAAIGRNLILIAIAVTGISISYGAPELLTPEAALMAPLAVVVSWYFEQRRRANLSTAGDGSESERVSGTSLSRFLVSPDKVRTLIVMTATSEGIWQEVCNSKEFRDDVFECHMRLLD